MNFLGLLSFWGYLSAVHTEAQEIETTCPYCGEPFTIIVDPSEGNLQRFVSDCEVCCHPIQFTATVDEEGLISLRAQRDSEV